MAIVKIKLGWDYVGLRTPTEVKSELIKEGETIEVEESQLELLKKSGVRFELVKAKSDK